MSTSTATFVWAEQLQRVLHTTSTAWGFWSRSHWQPRVSNSAGHLAVSY